MNPIKTNVITYDLSLSKKEVQDRIQEKIKNYNWTDILLADTIDYTEFKFDDDKIKIKRRPTALTTWGEIALFVEDIGNNKTRLNFQIISFHNAYPWVRPVAIVFGILLTLLGLLISRSITSVLIITSVWIFMSLFAYFRMRLEMYMMIRYTKLLVKDLC